jgi:hypothetical protein
MLKMITSPAQAVDNILKFEAEVESNPDMQGRLSYARAWYAHKNEKGQWCFAPSKFVGYQDMDAKTYLEAVEDGGSDGRRTEAQLQSYFETITFMHPAIHELNSALVAFLAKFGKSPSTKARINIRRGRRLLGEPKDAANDEVVEAMAVIAKAKLTREQVRALCDHLEDHLVS